MNNSYKLILLGESNVGKTSLVRHYVKDEFIEAKQSTIDPTFLTKYILVDNNTITLDIWDTAVQERYRSLAPMYYRNAAGAIIVYDITNYDSFTKAKTWLTELKRQSSPNIQIILVGNKSDLESNRTVVNNEAKSYAEENDAIFFETSARTKTNVQHAFDKIVKLMMEKIQLV